MELIEIVKILSFIFNSLDLKALFFVHLLNRHLKEELGQNTQILPVYIYVEKSSGNYKISVKFPGVVTKRTEESSGVKTGCEPKSFSEIIDGDGNTIEAGSFEVEGQVDPKNPDVLSGKKVSGELSYGQFTWTWNLRLVKPNQKKGLK